MSSKVDLKLDWCSHKAAKFACEHWHYSGCIPKSKLVKVGVWENRTFIGVVIFSYGATSGLVNPYGLKMTEGCELTRIALNSHSSSVTRVVSIALSMLKKENPKLRLVVSFADTKEGHVGGIYQGGNWVYTGTTIPADHYKYNGKLWHGRAFRSSFGSHKNYIGKGIEIIKGSVKYRYLYPLDDAMRKQIEPLRKSYPKKEDSSVRSVTSARQATSLQEAVQLRPGRTILQESACG